GLSPAAPQRGIELGLLGAGARRALSIVLNPGSCAQLRDMRDWDDGHRGTSWFKDTVAGRGFDNQGSDPASLFRSQDPLRRPLPGCRCPRQWLLCDLLEPD